MKHQHMDNINKLEIEYKKELSKLTSSFNELLSSYQKHESEALLREREAFENKIKRIDKRNKDEMMILEKRLIKYQTTGAGLDLEFRGTTPQLSNL